MMSVTEETVGKRFKKGKRIVQPWNYPSEQVMKSTTFWLDYEVPKGIRKRDKVILDHWKAMYPYYDEYREYPRSDASILGRKINLTHPNGKESPILNERSNPYWALTTEFYMRYMKNKEAIPKEELDSRASEIAKQINGAKSIVDEEPRLNLSGKTKQLHIKLIHETYAGLCPPCGKVYLTINGKKIDGEYEHFSSRKWNKVTDTWLICHDCHVKVGNSRSRYRADFDAYQRKMGELLLLEKGEENA